MWFQVRNLEVLELLWLNTVTIPPEDFLLLFQKRPEPFTSLHPKQVPFDRLEVDLREGVVLQLNTPNIISTDLVVSFFSLILSD